jgi:hypothetical protein
LPFGDKPELIVVFFELPSDEMRNQIEELGVKVKSINDFPLEQFDDNPPTKTDVCNIDTTSLITICSEIGYLDPNTKLSEKTQNMIVRVGFNNLASVIENKDKLFEEIVSYKRRIVCKSVWDTFVRLMEACGGENEIERMNEIKENVEIVPDSPSQRFKKMEAKEADKILFGTGETYKACTYTGNCTFLKNCKVFVNAKIFQSISLTERMLNNENNEK